MLKIVSEAIIAACAVLGVVMALSPIIVGRLVQRLQRAASAFYDRGDAGSYIDAESLAYIHDRMIDWAAALPAVANGLVRPPSRVNRDQVPNSVWAFLDDNAWALDYLAAVQCAVEVARSLSRPWDPRYWLSGLFFGLVLTAGANSDGSVDVIVRKKTESVVSQPSSANMATAC